MAGSVRDGGVHIQPYVHCISKFRFAQCLIVALQSPLLSSLLSRRAQHRPKQDNDLSDSSNAEKAPAKPKIDPETVTKPSSGYEPLKDL